MPLDSKYILGFIPLWLFGCGSKWLSSIFAWLNWFNTKKEPPSLCPVCGTSILSQMVWWRTPRRFQISPNPRNNLWFLGVVNWKIRTGGWEGKKHMTSAWFSHDFYMISPWYPMKSPRNPPFFFVKITASPFSCSFSHGYSHFPCRIFPMNSPLPRAGLPHGALPLPPLRLKRRGGRAAAPLGCWALAAWHEKWDAVGKTIWKNYGKLWRGKLFLGQWRKIDENWQFSDVCCLLFVSESLMIVKDLKWWKNHPWYTSGSHPKS